MTKVVQVPVYWLIVGIMVMLVSPVLSIVASAAINNRTIQTNERARAEARAESLIRYCRLLGSQVDVYSDAETPVGRDAYRTWLEEYNASGCQPGK